MKESPLLHFLGNAFGKMLLLRLHTYFVYASTIAVPLVGWYVSFFATISRTRLNMAIDYHRGIMSAFTLDFIKETLYHELSHASHYTKVGTGWYSNFVNAELA